MINLKSLNKFCQHLSIPSKEKGLTPLVLWGTQKFFLQEICKGLEDGIHFFYVLKGRQAGITTICLGLNLYWIFTHPGMQGTLVTEKTETLTENRSLLDGFYASLPRGLKPQIKTHNREILEFRNRSKLLYQVAGTKVKGQKNTLGQGKGINFCHGTEMSSWGDPEATDNFIASLAENYPFRLYLFESTAKGYNDFKDRWDDAKNAITKRAIFIGWWRDENRAIYPQSGLNRDKLIWDAYGGPAVGQEILWCQDVKRIFDFDINENQLTWWRWKNAEEISDEDTMLQFYPFTEDQAFIQGGYKFFDIERIRKADLAVKEYEPEFFRYSFRATFDETILDTCTPRVAQLKVWNQPEKNGYYVVAGDPAFGSNTDSDRYVVEIFRCYTDRCEQVAEYCTTEATTYQFAWIMFHLAGAYNNAFMIFEINGPGQAVWQEMQRLIMWPQYVGRNVAQGLMDVHGLIRQYLWTRPDALAGSYAYHFQTTGNTKELVFNQARDTFERDQLIIKSPDLLEEMRYIQQDEKGIGSATRKVHDDRAMATAMAVHDWLQYVQPELFEAGISYQAQRAKDILGNVEPGSVLAYQLQSYLSSFQRRGVQ